MDLPGNAFIRDIDFADNYAGIKVTIFELLDKTQTILVPIYDGDK